MKIKIMDNLFLYEELVSQFKGMCIQISLSRPTFLYSIFGLSLNILTGQSVFDFSFGLFGDFISFDIDWSRKCDHAGFRFSLIILGLMIHFNIYDTRHWNYDKNEFENYE